MEDLRARTEGRYQLNTDGLHTFIQAAQIAFDYQVDYAQIIKPQKRSFQNRQDEDDNLFLKPSGDKMEKHTIIGYPNLETAGTSHLESFNQTTRASLRRYTRKTTGHSKKLEQHTNALTLYFLYYNWIRPHSSLPSLTTPAMAAGLASRPFTLDGLLEYMDALAPPPKPHDRHKPRGKYKPRKPNAPPSAAKTQLEKLKAASQAPP